MKQVETKMMLPQKLERHKKNKGKKHYLRWKNLKRLEVEKQQKRKVGRRSSRSYKNQENNANLIVHPIRYEIIP